MSTGEGRKVSVEELSYVYNLIEECLVRYMTQMQVIHILHQKYKIEPVFTATVLQDLEEQNQEFFKAYYLRLAVKEQIMEFNDLLGRQAALMNQADPNRASFPPVFNVSHMPAMPYNGSCYVSEKMEKPHLSDPTVLVSGCNDCGPSIHSGMQHAVDRSTHSRRIDDVPTSNNMVSVHNSNIGMIQQEQGMEGFIIKREQGYLGNSQTGGNVLGAHPTIEHASISRFSSMVIDDGSSFEFFTHNSQNIGRRPDLAADFANRSDTLSFSNSAYLLPDTDNLFDSQGNKVEHQGPSTCYRM